MEGLQKRLRLDNEEFLKFLQVVKAGNLEFLKQLDVIDVIFIYEAFPEVRNRFKTHEVWKSIYYDTIVPQMKARGVNITRDTIGNNFRHVCIAWFFAFRTLDAARAKLSRKSSYHEIVRQVAVRKNVVHERENVYFHATQDDIPWITVSKYHTSARRIWGHQLQLFDNGSLHVDHEDTRWTVDSSAEALYHLAVIFNAELSVGLSLSYQYDSDQEFMIRNKI